MFAQGVYAASKLSDGEDESPFAQKYRRQQGQSFASSKWLMLACGSAALLSLAAHCLHARVTSSQSRRRQAFPNVTLSAAPLKTHKAGASTASKHTQSRDNAALSPAGASSEVVSPGLGPDVSPPASESIAPDEGKFRWMLGPTEPPRPVKDVNSLTGEEFHMCNAAVPAADLSGALPDSILTEPCGNMDAHRIAAALQSYGYSFENVLPQPYIYPAYLQQVLWMLKGKPLDLALKHLFAHTPLGHLGVLVKFFAWGLPVALSDLEAALGTATMDSLQTCGMLAKCARLQDMVTSSIMIYPVPNSTLLVATDWASRSTLGMHEEVVPIVDPEGMSLIYNAPRPKGLKVLDYDSGPGVQGFMAAFRGAAEVTMFSHSTRAARFIRFSSWMNNLKVKVLGTHDRLTDVFDLMLAQPTFLPIPNARAAAKYKRNGGKDGTKALRDTLKVATKVLGSSGLLALYTEFNAEDLINQESTKGICSLGLTGFSGSTVIRSEPLQPDAYAMAHADVADVDEQVANMGKERITGISNGFLFAKREETWQKNECGSFSLQLLEDPIRWPTKTTSKFDRACYLSQETHCPDDVNEE